MNNKFSLYDAYVVSFKIILNNLVFFLVSMLITVFSSFLFLLFLGVVSYPTLSEMAQITAKGTVSIGAFGILFALFLYVLYVGWIKMALDMQEHKAVGYDYLHKFYYFVPRVFCIVVLRFFATMVGVVLFIVPGIYVYQRLRFAQFFVIDKNQSCAQALASSWDLTKGSVLHLVGYSIISSFIDSIIPVLPLTSQVEVNMYRQMTKED